MDFVDVEEDFRGVILLDLKINIILVIFSLFELLIRYNIDVEIRDISYILQLKQLLIIKYININFNIIITFYIKIAIINKNKISLIKLLKYDLIKIIKIIINIKK